MLITGLILIFIVGYLFIAFEHQAGINKAASALITGTLMWTVYMLSQDDKVMVSEALRHHLGSIAEILFFLLGAMTIVEMIDAHDGFQVIVERIKTQKYKQLVWIIGIITFFLSAVLDNLTTTIVMVSVLRKLIPDAGKRLYFVGFVVIAANAGGAWSPIGDVTTTMLWIGNQVTALNIIYKVFLPSIVCVLIPMLLLSRKFGNQTIDSTYVASLRANTATTPFERAFVFYSGIGILLMVPVLKTLTHMPPYTIMLMGLGVLWIITEWVHKGKNAEDKDALTVVFALRKIDTPSILFFLGILLSVATLEQTRVLRDLATSLQTAIGNDVIIVVLIGLLSAIVDNVPLVAAAQGMYPLTQYPTDHYFWEFLAYATGTGGSALIIGSAAGVTAMGLDNIDFFWYLKRITWLALLGYFAGAMVFVLQQHLI